MSLIGGLAVCGDAKPVKAMRKVMLCNYRQRERERATRRPHEPELQPGEPMTQAVDSSPDVGSCSRGSFPCAVAV